MPSPSSPRLRLGFAGPSGCPTPHLSVDGMTPVGPNLSHWPGNRTPPQWRADLSTGIALRYSRADTIEQERFLGDAQLVLNDHYDTDGFGSLLAVLRPQVAHDREEVLLAAAATGDFGVWHTWRAFAIDRAIVHLAAPASPVAATFAAIRDPQELSLRRYAWLLDHAEELLDQPQTFAPVYAEELARVQEEIDAGLRGAIEQQLHRELGLAVLTSTGPRHRMTLNTLAGAYRVLHVQGGTHGPRYRFHDRTESWFAMVTLQPLPRRDLRELARQLDALEPGHDGARWCADPPQEPIPELYFGVPAAQEYGQITRQLMPSRLRPAQVTEALLSFFSPHR